MRFGALATAASLPALIAAQGMWDQSYADLARRDAEAAALGDFDAFDFDLERREAAAMPEPEAKGGKKKKKGKKLHCTGSTPVQENHKCVPYAKGCSKDKPYRVKGGQCSETKPKHKKKQSSSSSDTSGGSQQSDSSGHFGLGHGGKLGADSGDSTGGRFGRSGSDSSSGGSFGSGGSSGGMGGGSGSGGFGGGKGSGGFGSGGGSGSSSGSSSGGLKRRDAFAYDDEDYLFNDYGY